MKILELHLRNIASIESADIDFENDPGLIDPDTGRPAQKFLIYGDTGTGKSVILDGISMAIYGTTPRISGVANQQRNSYTATSGNVVNITSLEQYTRLGISHKDPCYSQVVFVGNDGLRYSAKMTLGYTRFGNSKKKWTLAIDDADEIEVKNEVPDNIVKAVGLTFAQWSRMAMLAQGQFASFLCGDRDTRADILEKLTQTEHFTAYGHAIAAIAKEKAEKVRDAEKTVNTYEGIFLSPEQEQELCRQRNEASAAKETIGKEMLRLKGRIDAIEKIQDESHKLADATARQEQLQHVDDASQQRYSFNSLALALLAFEQRCSAEQTRLAGEAAWFAERSSLDRFYTDAALTLKDLEAYKALTAELFALEQSKQKAMGQVKFLAQALEAARKGKADAEKASSDKQREIERLTDSLKALDPEKLDSESQRLTNLRHRLETLAADFAKHLAEKETLDANRKQSKDLEGALSDAAKEKEAAERDLKRKQATLDEARERFSTSSASLNETLVELRKKLASGYADICPLCGQKIGADLLTVEQFRNIVSPFEEAQKAAQQAYNLANERFQTASKNHAELGGKKSTLDDAIGRAQQKFDADGEALLKRLSSEEISPSDDIPTTIQTRLAAAGNALKQIQQQKSKAADLQKQINATQSDKNALDASRDKAIEAFNTAEKAVQNNQKDIENFTAQASSKSQSLNQAALALDGTILPWATAVGLNWRENIDEVCKQLSAQSAAYLGRKKTYDTDLSALEKSREDLADMADVRKRLHEHYPQWALPTVAPEGASRRCTIAEWYTLEKACDLCQSQITSAQNTIAEMRARLALEPDQQLPALADEQQLFDAQKQLHDKAVDSFAQAQAKLDTDSENRSKKLAAVKAHDAAQKESDHWALLAKYFGGDRFRNLVQTHILRPLLSNANVYLSQITDRYTLTCSPDNEQLSILVLDRYNRDEVRSVAVLSGGERFMISLALSLALSSLTKPDMNVNILFIDEGFGTLDQECLNSVMQTLGNLGAMAGQADRRVGIITHREELLACIPNRIRLQRCGQGRSRVEVAYETD